MHYPNCEKLATRTTEQQHIFNFLTWLEEKNVAFVVPVEGGQGYLHQTQTSMVLEYFGIDEQQLENERRHILENCS